MNDTQLSPREEDDALAAEYVVGVLDLDERGIVEARIKREPGFAAMVTAWENRMAGMNDAYASAKAPDLLPAIEARLFPKPSSAQKSRGKLSGFLGWFSGATIAAILVMAFIALVPPPRPMLIATLAAADTGLSYEVVQFGDGLKVTRVAGESASVGRVHELWLIAPGANPVSLGLLAEAPLIIDHPVPPAGWLLAVSLEPEGGSKTGGPTGPVILSAEIGI